MIATRQFVFLHVPKTGGSFLVQAIRDHTAAEDLGQHGHYRKLPERYRALPALCFVRNPWDWYVSYWHQRRRQGFEGDLRDLLRIAYRGDVDTYTRSFRRIAGDGVEDGHVDVGRFESLREDFVAFLERHGVEEPALREAVLNSPPLNISERTHYRSYYDDETRELVARCPMRQYGYEW